MGEVVARIEFLRKGMSQRAKGVNQSFQASAIEVETLYTELGKVSSIAGTALEVASTALEGVNQSGQV